MTWMHPFSPETITSRFGETARRTTPHRGTDYAPEANALIPAVADGTVRKIAWSNCLGWYMVQSAWADNKTWYIGYNHLSCKTHGINCKGPKEAKPCSTPFIRLKVGDKLTKGQPAGRVGNSGNCSRGAHLHLTLSRSVTGNTLGRVYNIEEFINKMNDEKMCPTCKRPL